MRHTRKALLTALVLAAVVLASTGSSRIAGATSFVRQEPVAPSVQPTTSQPPDPNNTGEPDSGAGRGQQVGGPNALRTTPPPNAQYITAILRTLRLTGLVWARHFLGLGD